VVKNPKKQEPKMMTKKQLTMIHVIMHKAWDAECFQAGKNAFHDAKAAEDWRRNELEAVVGQRSTKGLTQTQFEDAMVHFAMIAQDNGLISHFAAAAQRRYRWQLHRFLRLVSDVKGVACGWSYVRSLMDKMTLPDDMMDMTEWQMSTVLMALDTHYRRLFDRLAAFIHTDGPTELRRHLESSRPGVREHALERLAHARKMTGAEPARAPTADVAHVLRDIDSGHVAKI
jgi:hypothetical protein